MNSRNIALIGIILSVVLGYAISLQYMDSKPEMGSEEYVPPNTDNSIDNSLSSLREYLFAFKTSYTVYVDMYGILDQEIEPSTFDVAATKDIIEKSYDDCAGQCPYELLHYMIWFNMHIENRSLNTVFSLYPNLKTRFDKVMSEDLSYDNLRETSFYLYSKQELNILTEEEEMRWFYQFVRLPAPETEVQRHDSISFLRKISNTYDIKTLKERLILEGHGQELYIDPVSINICFQEISSDLDNGCSLMYSIKGAHFCNQDGSADDKPLREHANRIIDDKSLTCRNELKYIIYYENPENWYIL